MNITSQNDVPADLIYANDAARIAKVHLNSLDRWIMRGHLRAWKRVGRYLVSEAELRALTVPVAPRRERQMPEYVETAAQRRKRERQPREMLERAGLM